MVPEETHILPDRSEKTNEIPKHPEPSVEANDEKRPRVEDGNVGCLEKTPQPYTEENPVANADYGGPVLESLDNVLGDGVAVNFEPQGRYFVETQVNFITNNMALSMTRMVRTRQTPIPQRSHQDPEATLALVTKPCGNYRIKSTDVLKFITNEPEISDFKITLYIVACESSSPLKPYPVSIVEESEAGQESLSLLNEEIPSVKLLKIILKNGSQSKTCVPVIRILHWLLVILQEPKIKRLPFETFHTIFDKVENAVNFQEPTFVFKMMFSRSSSTETTWKAKKGDRRSYFAFYSDSLERMHSIIHIGFYPALLEYRGKTGPGIYFYADLKHCLEIAGASSCWGWGKSDIGVEMKVVLVVELLEGPGLKTFNDALESTTEERALTNGTDGEDELLCYCASRPDEIRIRYALVYVKTKARNFQAIMPPRNNTLVHWLGEHKTPLFIGGTICLTIASRHYAHLLSVVHGFKGIIHRLIPYSIDIKH